MPSSSESIDSLASQLLVSRLSQSDEEARSVAEACLFEEGGDGDRSGENAAGADASSDCAAALREYFPDLTEKEASAMAKKSLGVEVDPASSSEEDEDEDGNDDEFEDATTDEDEYIGEGECELCERTIRLTRHHLIPKSTWPKIRNRLLRAADAIARDDIEKAQRLLGGEDVDFPGLVGQEITRDFVRRYIQRTCDICRPCHNTVQRLHNEMELAERYNTVEKLLTDKDVVKFCMWANKQRPGKYAL